MLEASKIEANATQWNPKIIKFDDNSPEMHH